MDSLNVLLSKIGIDIQLILTLAGAVLLIVNTIKDKFSPFMDISGGATQIVALIVSFGLSALVYSQFPNGFNWIGFAVTGFICWLGPDSLNGYLNRKLTKVNKL